MKNYLYALAILIWSSFGVLSQSYSIDFEWATRAGGSYSDYGYSIAVDASNNSYITGSFGLEATFGNTTLTSSNIIENIFIAKLDSGGNFLWAKGVGLGCGYDIVSDASGNSYVTGNFSGTANFDSTILSVGSTGGKNIFIAKLDANGSFLWAKQVVMGLGLNHQNNGCGIAIDASGNSYVTGRFQGTATFGTFSLTASGSTDIFIAKLDTNGNFIWVKQAGGSDIDSGYGVSDVGYGISVDASGNSYITGLFQGTATFGNITLTRTGVGYGREIFIVKLDTNGNFLWAKQAGEGSYPTSSRYKYQQITVDASGNSYITAKRLPLGSIIAKLDVNGNYLWTKQIESFFQDYNGIAIDASGNSYVTGYFSGTVMFDTITLVGEATGTNIFIAKLDANSNFLWAAYKVGDNVSVGYDIALDALGNAYVVGGLGGIETFGNTTLVSAGQLDIFITKIKEEEVLSISDLDEKNTFTIFPNPANEQFTLTGLSGNSTIQVVNLNGQVLLKSLSKEQETTINTENLKSGTYIVRISNENQIVSKKLIVNK